MSETIGGRIAAALRAESTAYVAGDEVAPCAVLWNDPERHWESIVPHVQLLLPELFVLGEYTPAKNRGPALWLRCVEARVVDGAPPNGTTPIFYLPGISRETLRAVEDCPPELSAVVELQFRGVTWLHVNGKEWTPYAFLVSKHGGLGLDVARDQRTLEALSGALPSLMGALVADLFNRRLESDFFNGLLAPDATGLLLRWLSDSDSFKQRCTEAEWKAFCEQSKADFRFDPVRDGPLKAAKLLAEKSNSWSKAWQRFAEAPANYPGVVEWLKRAAPKNPSMFDKSEVWPDINATEERKLQEALESLADRPQEEAIRRIGELEALHSPRREYPWQKLGLSPLATILSPLARLAQLCAATPGFAASDDFAAYYARDGWHVDAAALATLAAAGTIDENSALLGVLRSIYLPWLESTARRLQHLIEQSGGSVAKRSAPIDASSGRLVLFADGLRMDVAQLLAAKLGSIGLESMQDWEWSTIPSVTNTAKPAASPIASIISGGETGDGFCPELSSSNKTLTQERFVGALREHGWQVLGSADVGDPMGSAWAEAGTLDKRGHNEGWKLARSVETEVSELASRIRSLLKSGWREVIVVTDHGWLLLPGGLPKVELKVFLTDDRWGRCASLKSGAQTDTASFKWHWNSDLAIASPPGVGCYRANMEYTHGGVSLQEMVIPVLRIKASRSTGGGARLLTTHWTGAKCRVLVGGNCSGMRVDVRTRSSDPDTSLLTDKQARELTSDCNVTVFLENDSDIGKNAEIVLLDASNQVIDSQLTTLGETST